MKKQRQQILLEPEQKKRLKAESDSTGVPQSEIMRRALDRYFEEDDKWDQQMKRDLKAGRLDDILAKAKKQYKQGNTEALSRALEQSEADIKAGRVYTDEEAWQEIEQRRGQRSQNDA